MNQVCLIESFGMNGLRNSWGQMTVIFKNKGLFADYCTEEGDCSERNKLFNTVFQLWFSTDINKYRKNHSNQSFFILYKSSGYVT